MGRKDLERKRRCMIRFLRNASSNIQEVGSLAYYVGLSESSFNGLRVDNFVRCEYAFLVEKCLCRSRIYIRVICFVLIDSWPLAAKFMLHICHGVFILIFWRLVGSSLVASIFAWGLWRMITTLPILLVGRYICTCVLLVWKAGWASFVYSSVPTEGDPGCVYSLSQSLPWCPSLWILPFSSTLIRFQ